MLGANAGENEQKARVRDLAIITPGLPGTDLREAFPPEAKAQGRADSILPDFAAQAAKIIRDGGKVAIGSRGEPPGLGFRFGMWALASGGTPTHDVLRAGTIVGAEAIGLDRHLGSLEAGKLADLQVIDGHPVRSLLLQ